MEHYAPRHCDNGSNLKVSGEELYHQFELRLNLFKLFRGGLFKNSFCFSESFSKTGKLRALLENHPAALKLEANKKVIYKAALMFFP